METKNTQSSNNKIRATYIILSLITAVLMIPNTYEAIQLFSQGEITNQWIGHNYVSAEILSNISIICYALIAYHYCRWTKRNRDSLSE